MNQRQADNRRYDAEREAQQPWRTWYRTPEWKALRKAHVAREPECRYCRQMGRYGKAEHVDHINRHGGDRAKFFDPANLQSLCATHHNSTKQRAEKGRQMQAIGPDGWPLE